MECFGDLHMIYLCYGLPACKHLLLALCVQYVNIVPKQSTAFAAVLAAGVIGAGALWQHYPGQVLGLSDFNLQAQL